MWEKEKNKIKNKIMQKRRKRIMQERKKEGEENLEMEGKTIRRKQKDRKKTDTLSKLLHMSPKHIKMICDTISSVTKKNLREDFKQYQTEGWCQEQRVIISIFDQCFWVYLQERTLTAYYLALTVRKLYPRWLQGLCGKKINLIGEIHK